MDSATSPFRICSGRFEADLRTGELFRDGLRVPLQPKPFAVLAQLLQAPDGWVSRSELCERVWPEVHVNRDLSLNAAVRKLRLVLKCQGEEVDPIETMGSHGYRWRMPRGTGVDSQPRPEPSWEIQRKFQKGLQCFARVMEVDLLQAVALFQEVIAEDDGFAPAYSALALCYAYGCCMGPMAPEQAFPRLEKLVARALELDPERAEAHAARGVALLMYRADFQGAETAFRKALRLKPGLHEATIGFAQIGMADRRFGEAIAALRDLLARDAADHSARAFLGMAHYFGGDFHQALSITRELIPVQPGFAMAPSIAGWALSALGRHDEALEMLHAAAATRPDSPILAAHLAYGLAAAGHAEAAREQLHRVVGARRRGWVPPYAIALAYVALGDHSTAYGWLEKAIEERDGWRILSGVDPRLRPMAGHKRLRHLLHAAGLFHPLTDPPLG